MSLRTLVRFVALALGLALASPLAPTAMRPFLPLVGIGLLGLALGYLALLAGEPPLTRWQLRYRLEAGDNLDHLEQILRFLAEKTGHFVVEASTEGLFLELPSAFDRYVEAQLSQALPELRLSKDDGTGTKRSEGSFFLSIGPLSSDLPHWATESDGRLIRLHIHQGPYATLTAQTDGTRPPGRWVRMRLPNRLWHRLPMWDELSTGVRLSSLFPPTGDGAVYSSRSQLLQLAPPDDYHADATDRYLGQSAAGRPLALSYAAPLFTTGAPSSFLAQQALGDLATGRTIVVVSPRRRVLEQIERQATETPVYWLDPQGGRKSTHLAIVSAGEWAAVNVETVVRVTSAFLADLDLDVDLPAVGAFIHHLLHALADSAQQTAQAFTFTDLYAISRSTQTLRAFLNDAPGEAARALLAQLDDDGGYVQAVTILSAMRTALKPLDAGPLHALCQPPFLNAGKVVRESSLLLAPMTNSDFPEHDHLLGAMLDLTLSRVLTGGDDVNVALHLHDPHLYRSDGGRRWIDAARRDSRLSLLLDTQNPDAYCQVTEEGTEGEVIFRCSEALASGIIGDWELPVSLADLIELPPNTAIARLPGMVVTLQESDK